MPKLEPKDVDLCDQVLKQFKAKQLEALYMKLAGAQALICPLRTCLSLNYLV